MMFRVLAEHYTASFQKQYGWGPSKASLFFAVAFFPMFLRNDFIVAFKFTTSEPPKNDLFSLRPQPTTR